MSGLAGIYLRCRVGREWYGINTDNVFKVLQLVALNELPDADPSVLGLLTLPDCVIPVIDLRRYFGLPEATLGLETPIVAVNTSHGAVGLVVDDADDIETIVDAQLEPFNNDMSTYIVSIARCPDCILLLIDISLLGAKVWSDISVRS